jgi:hypothetical protein
MARKPVYPMRYLVRDGEPWQGAPETYEVGKVEEGAVVGVYHVWRDPEGRLMCDCPSGIHHPSDEVVCKHRRWVAEGLAAARERPWVLEVASARDDGRLADLGLEAYLLEEMVAARSAR